MNETISIARMVDATLLNVLGVGVHVLMDECDSDGHGVVALCVCDPGEGAPPHSHEQLELFVVLDGLVSFFDGNAWISAGEGDLVKVPAGCIHAFRNDSPTEARFLTISTPASHARFFREADELGKEGSLVPSSIEQLCNRSGIKLWLPPEELVR